MKTPKKVLQQRGKRVRELREAAGLSQQDLADELGIYRSFISQVESGDRDLRLYEANLLARLLDVELEWLIGDGRG